MCLVFDELLIIIRLLLSLFLFLSFHGVAFLVLFGLTTTTTTTITEEGTKAKHTYLQEAAANGLHYDCLYVELQGNRAKHHLQAMSLGGYQSRVNYDAIIKGLSVVPHVNRAISPLLKCLCSNNT